MIRCITLGIIFLECINSVPGAPPEIITDWTYDSGQDDWSIACALDGPGSIYITGTCNDFSNRNIRTLKYLWDGTIDFNVTYDGGEGDFVSDIALDQDRNSYIAAETYLNGDYDTCIIKYDFLGNEVWRMVADLGGIDRAEGIAADADGVLHIVGEKGEFSDGDIFLMKATFDGDTVWTRTFDSGFDDWTPRVAIDAWGYGYISANVDLDPTTFRVIKYDWNGSVEWISRFNSPYDEVCEDIAVDIHGDCYVTGYSDTDEGCDIRITKYSDNGSEIWTRIFDGDMNGRALGITTDGSGSAIVTGSLYDKYSESLVILKYNSSGDLVWAYVDEGPENIEGFDLTVDDNGYLHIAATQDIQGLHDFRTQKYRQYFSISGCIRDGQTGVSDVSVRLTGHYNMTDTTDASGNFEFSDLPCAHDYRIYPEYAGADFDPPEYEYPILGYDQLQQDFEMTLGGEFPGPDQSLDLTVENPVHPGGAIRYYLPCDTRMKLSILDMAGREIHILKEGHESTGVHKEFWPWSCTGVFILRFDTGENLEYRPIVVIRN